MLDANLTTQKILVCITIQHNSKRLIKKGHEIAQKTGAELHILHIAKGDSIFNDPKNGPLLDDLFKYASGLGAEVHFGCSSHVTKYIASFIKDHGITCIVLGETLRNALSKFFKKNIEISLEAQKLDLEIIVLERDSKTTSNTNTIVPT